MVLTEAGEVGVQATPLPLVIFRPTLFAMSRIGEPDEIVALAVRLFGGTATIDDALRVLWACCDDDCSAYTGYLGGDTTPEYVAGVMPVHDIVVMSIHLLQHGLVGKSIKQRESKPATDTANATFNASEFVAIAIAQLRMSERDAWRLSMTTLVNALHSKFPDMGAKTGPGSAAPSGSELDADMKRLEEINKQREVKNAR